MAHAVYGSWLPPRPGMWGSSRLPGGRLGAAQNAHFWTALVLVGFEPSAVQNAYLRARAGRRRCGM